MKLALLAYCIRKDIKTAGVLIFDESKQQRISIRRMLWCDSSRDRDDVSDKSLRGPMIQKFNIEKGDYEFVPTSFDYDYHQEIARAGYADMLHDSDRNEKYDQAIKYCINKLKRNGKEVHVLDIGAGTGLLSMMAAKHGADYITACESFKPMYDIAVETINKNGMMNKINIVHKDSMALKVGVDLPKKVNLLVTEVFDTELIGERALATYRHAAQNLIRSDACCVPHAGTVHTQIVSSAMIRQWSRLRPPSSLLTTRHMSQCPGVNTVWDVQLDQLTSQDYTPLTAPQPVFRYVWGDASTLPAQQHHQHLMQSVDSGQADGLLMWWTLDMTAAADPADSIVLSCEPKHVNQNAQWQDHWMHAIYPFPHPITLSAAGQQFVLRSCQDDYSYWFDVLLPNDMHRTMITAFGGVMPRDIAELPEPECSCHVHRAYSRARVSELNDSGRYDLYRDAMKMLVKPGSVCVSINDGSLLPFLAVQLGASKVYCFEREPSSLRCMRELVNVNNMGDRIILLDSLTSAVTHEHLMNDEIDVILTEPYFHSLVLPWDSLHIAFAKHQLSPFLREQSSMLVTECTLKCVAVELKDLWKIRSPVNKVMGFDMTPFHDVITSCSEASDSSVEPHPMWEYQSRVLSDVHVIHRFDVTDVDACRITPGHNITCTVNATAGDNVSAVNALVIWMDYTLCNGTHVPTGLLSSNPPLWYRARKQGVYFMPGGPPWTRFRAAGDACEVTLRRGQSAQDDYLTLSVRHIPPHTV